MPLEVIVILTTIYVLLNIGSIFFTLLSEDLHKIRFMLPNDLKRITTMNWFGCSVVSLFCFMFFPLIYLYRLFEFLFHI